MRQERIEEHSLENRSKTLSKANTTLLKDGGQPGLQMRTPNPTLHHSVFFFDLEIECVALNIPCDFDNSLLKASVA